MASTQNFQSSTNPAAPDAGPFLARVISHQDSSFMGTLQVELLRPIGNSAGGIAGSSELRIVSYLSPFYGVTGARYIGQDPNDYNQTQKSYGMWMVPPDVGTTVMVIFIQGDVKRGFWIGCVPDENMNFMIPGIAATEQVVEGGNRAPVAEYNKRVNESTADPTTYTKPRHPLYNKLVTQGLDQDDTRGITTSSSRRETPSMVFGISTPGPVDKQPNAKKGPIGQADSQIPNAFVSRLGGATFVMDDGDSAFLRKTDASKGPPEYVAIEQNETGGDVTIPHNELVRIRTRTGHQILLHNSEDLIYIGNAKGTTWIELTSNGKIDIYAKDSVSVHSENDINFTADRDINFTAKRNFNLNSAGTNNLTATGATNIRSGGNHVETAANIHMNGPAAAVAPKASRIPQHEPWAGHEHLNPTAYTPAKTAAVANPVAPTATYWKKYTTSIDTFKRVPPPEQGNQ
jgi:Type VI secretion system/phage-baseplate injector OB domain